MVEVLTPKEGNKFIKLQDMKNENGELIDSTPSAQMIFTIHCDEELKVDDILIKCKGNK